MIKLFETDNEPSADFSNVLKGLETPNPESLRKAMEYVRDHWDKPVPMRPDQRAVVSPDMFRDMVRAKVIDEYGNWLPMVASRVKQRALRRKQKRAKKQRRSR